jgi:hypothetical protein
MQIRPDDLTGFTILALRHEHVRHMPEVSPKNVTFHALRGRILRLH